MPGPSESMGRARTVRVGDFDEGTCCGAGIELLLKNGVLYADAIKLEVSPGPMGKRRVFSLNENPNKTTVIKHWIRHIRKRAKFHARQSTTGGAA